MVFHPQKSSLPARQLEILREMRARGSAPNGRGGDLEIDEGTLKSMRRPEDLMKYATAQFPGGFFGPPGDHRDGFSWTPQRTDNDQNRRWMFAAHVMVLRIAIFVRELADRQRDRLAGALAHRSNGARTVALAFWQMREAFVAQQTKDHGASPNIIRAEWTGTVLPCMLARIDPDGEASLERLVSSAIRDGERAIELRSVKVQKMFEADTYDDIEEAFALQNSAYFKENLGDEQVLGFEETAKNSFRARANRSIGAGVWLAQGPHDQQPWDLLARDVRPRVHLNDKRDNFRGIMEGHLTKSQTAKHFHWMEHNLGKCRLDDVLGWDIADVKQELIKIRQDDAKTIKFLDTVAKTGVSVPTRWGGAYIRLGSGPVD